MSWLLVFQVIVGFAALIFVMSVPYIIFNYGGAVIRKLFNIPEPIKEIEPIEKTEELPKSDGETGVFIWTICILIAIGLIVSQAYTWLKYGAWPARDFEWVGVPPPNFEWKGIQQIALWLYNSPIAVWLFLSGYFLVRD